METELITISEYCVNYSVDPSFITALEDSGLIVLTVIEDNKFIHYKQLVEMERFVHFHYDLQINIEGIEAIMNLLQKIKHLQHEITTLKSHVYLYEPNG
ncbi:MAG TPA: chaperone modulator CbpM [Pedobacter sp.]